MPSPIRFGSFLLVDRVAVGGMAEVFAAVRAGEAPGRAYAVKRMLPTLAEHEDLVKMFLDEARLQVQLDHPGIPPVHELGRLQSRYYMAMDYVAGRDLRALVDRARARRERLPVALAAHVAWRVLDALDHAHRRRGANGGELRIVHRDVSPANVLVGFDGIPRLIDFGIAQAAVRGAGPPDVLRGKFGYMSPEMVRGLPVDRRSDVFAAGVVLHELLTGERLFTGPSELAVMEKVRAADVRRPSEAHRSVPRALDDVVLRALAREPEQRFAWASELRDALLPFTRGAEPDDPGPLAREMARAFPAELRAEAGLRERLRAACEGPAKPRRSRRRGA
jgi:eukaryotic-like serine/threonine-protein kinase